ncbi:MAG: hypothetical protein QM743_06435 [Chitinophagaceae bacterium]
MKTTKASLLAIFLLLTLSAGAQKTDSGANFEPLLSIRFGTMFTRILDKDLWGAQFGFSVFVSPRWTTGISIGGGSRKTNQTFSFTVLKPVVDYYELSWRNEYELYNKGRIRAGLMLDNGLAYARLGDNAFKTSYSTRYGKRYRSKEISTDYFYLFQPGCSVSLSLGRPSASSEILLSGTAQYRMVWGNPKYGDVNQFRNYSFGLMLNIIGMDYPGKKKKPAH